MLNKMLFFCLAFALVFLLIQSESCAQTIACPPCSSSVQPTTIQITIPGGTVTVTYRKYPCNGIQVLQIISIAATQSMYESYSPAEIHENTIFEILKDNPMNMPPMVPDSGNVWKITQPACWYLPSGMLTMVVCPAQTQCCESTVYVFLTECGRVFEAINGSNVTDCGSWGPALGCFYICDNKIRAGSSNSPFPIVH